MVCTSVIYWECLPENWFLLLRRRLGNELQNFPENRSCTIARLSKEKAFLTQPPTSYILWCLEWGKSVVILVLGCRQRSKFPWCSLLSSLWSSQPLDVCHRDVPIPLAPFPGFFLSTPLIVYTKRYQGLEEVMGAGNGWVHCTESLEVLLSPDRY